MGIEENKGPPKKKLKQAQLPFCVLSSEKTRNKRKLNHEGSPQDEVQAVKLPRQDTTPILLTANKENLKLNSGSSTFCNFVDLTCDSNKMENIEINPDDVSSKEIERTVETKVDNVNKGETSAETISATVESHSQVQSVKALSELAKPSNDVLSNPSNSCLENIRTDENPPNKASKSAELSHVTEEQTTCDKDVLVLAETSEVPMDQHDEPSPPIDVSGTRDSEDRPDVDPVKTQPKSMPASVADSENNLLKVVGEKEDSSNESSGADLNSSILISDSDEPSLVTDKSPKDSLPLTPKQKAKQLRMQMRKEKKMQLRKEKEDSMRQKKEEKKKKKLEEQQMKENERKRKIEERKRREEAKEDEKKKKEEERKKKEEAKEEERKKKEDERKRKEELKEEDRRKKEEAKLADERKENLVKMAFSKFFIPPKPKSSLSDNSVAEKPAELVENMKFMPFPVKTDMKLAVVVRHSISQEEKEVLTNNLNSNVDKAQLYLEMIKTGERKPMKTGATWPVSEEQHDVIVVETEVEECEQKNEEVAHSGKLKRTRAKLLMFHENRRPPYWGSWRKMSTNVTARRPFGKDNLFDYDVDSDLEWEDEEEGEDIEKEGDSDKEQSDDENAGEHGYILDKTFVPHGYLSDEEAAKGEEDEEESSDPEEHKLKLNILKQEFEQDLKSKTQRLKPRLLGLVMVPNDVTEVSRGSLYETIMNFRCVWNEADGPLNPLAPVHESPPTTPSSSVSKFTPAVMEHLVKLVHGSRASHLNLVAEFISLLEKEKLPQLSKRAIKIKIKEIARKVVDTTARMVWKVNADLCAEFDLPELATPQKLSNTVTSSPSPAVEASPKIKETPLANFLARAAPQEVKKRVTPTLISSTVGGQTFNADPSSASKSNSTPAAPPQPVVRKRIIPITLSKTTSFMTSNSASNAAATPTTHFQVSKSDQDESGA